MKLRCCEVHFEGRSSSSIAFISDMQRLSPKNDGLSRRCLRKACNFELNRTILRLPAEKPSFEVLPTITRTAYLS
jgi:hypothetical protein